jgi:NADH-quinone oxidoreductase subunit K
LIAFAKYGAAPSLTGHIFTLFTISVAAAEAAVGVAVLIALFRSRGTVNIDEFDEMRR